MERKKRGERSGRERERERERSEREREKDEESIRIGKERKSPRKTDVPKLYTYNDCEHSVVYSGHVVNLQQLFKDGYIS